LKNLLSYSLFEFLFNNCSNLCDCSFDLAVDILHSVVIHLLNLHDQTFNDALTMNGSDFIRVVDEMLYQ